MASAAAAAARIKEFACTYKNQSGTLKVGAGEFSWTPSKPGSGGVGIPSQSLSAVQEVQTANIVQGMASSVAFRIVMKSPRATFFDLKSFKTLTLRDEAKASLLGGRGSGGAGMSSTPTSILSPMPPSSPAPSSSAQAEPAALPPPPRQKDPGTFTSQPMLTNSSTVQLRAQLLQRNEKLRALHKKLVGGKIVSEEDFWVGKEAMISEQRALSAQVRGLPSTSLLDPSKDKMAEATKQQQRQNDDATTAVLPTNTVLTPDMIRRIFVEHPTVLQRYKSLVPHSLSEEQFWTSYLHSRYVLGARRNVDFAELRRDPNAQIQRNKRKELEKQREAEAEKRFDNVDVHRLNFRKELERKFQARIPEIDPSVDLTKTFDDSIATSAVAGMPHAGYGILKRENDWFVYKSAQELARSLAANRATSNLVENSREKLEEITRAVKDDPFLSTINERATVLARQQFVDETEVSTSQVLREKRLKLDHEAELRLDGDLNHNMDAAEDGAKAKFQLKPPTPAANVAESDQALPLLFAMSREFDPNFAFPTVENCFDFEHEAKEHQQRQFGAAAEFDFATDLPDAIKEAFILEIKAVDEYCRHFWSAPPKSNKRCLIVPKMKEVSQRINGALREAIRAKASHGSFLLRLPLAQLSRALEEHAKDCTNQACA